MQTTHKNETAGAYLTTNVPTIHLSKKVADIKAHILKSIKEYTSIHYSYILDSNQHLIGVISIKEILTAPGDTPLGNFVPKHLVVARRHTSTERVAQLAISHNISAIPVIDSNKTFLGVVTADDIHDILNYEHSKDILQLAGVNSKERPNLAILDERASSHIKSRLPWLLLGLLGGIAAALVVGSHDEALGSNIMLAAFIPAIVYIADSVGAQTQMIFIRALALNPSLSLSSYVIREAIINTVLAIVLGLGIFVISSIWLQEYIIATILGVSVFFTVIVSVLVAIILPYLSMCLHKDPAVASGPIATVFRDILSLMIYLSIASALLTLT
jgi:magnesium transporter